MTFYFVIPAKAHWRQDRGLSNPDIRVRNQPPTCHSEGATRSGLLV